MKLTIYIKIEGKCHLSTTDVVKVKSFFLGTPVGGLVENEFCLSLGLLQDKSERIFEYRTLLVDCRFLSGTQLLLFTSTVTLSSDLVIIKFDSKIVASELVESKKMSSTYFVTLKKNIFAV